MNCRQNDKSRHRSKKMSSSQSCSHRNSVQNAPVESSTALTATLFVKNHQIDPDPEKTSSSHSFPTICSGSQGPKGAIGPLKKVASLRETARLVNQKIAQSLPKVDQKFAEIINTTIRMGRASRAPFGLLFFVFRQTFGQLLANFLQTLGNFLVN